MKYSVEYKDGQFKETLEVDGNTVHKYWKRETDGTLQGLCSHDSDFCDQLVDVLDEDVCDNIYEIFDCSMLVADVEDFIRDNDVE
jgi:hypothetical protein